MAEDLAGDDKSFLWHPFTQMKDYLAEEPIIIESAKGSILKEINGKELIDGVSSIWAISHGHCREEINRAISEQASKVSHSTLLGLSNVPAIRLARKLVGIAPAGLKKVFYSDDGSTAVEVALKMAFQYWRQKAPRRRRRQKFVSFHGAYHGDTLGAVSVGGIGLFGDLYRPLLFSTYKVHYPYCYRCHLGLNFPGCGIECQTELRDLLRKRSGEIAGLIIEPLLQAAAGMVVAPPGHLKAVSELCQQHGILLMADEVATGFGRTGRMFACEHEGVSPDLMAISKGLTGGYLPLAATLTTEEVYSAFLGGYEERKTFFHGHTFTGNPLACSAAMANLEIFEKENTLETLKLKIERLKEGLEQFRPLSNVGDIRQIGFVAGLELVKNKDTKEPFPFEDRIGHKVAREARRRGLFMRPLGDVLVVMPPLGTSLELIDEIAGILKESILAVCA